MATNNSRGNGRRGGWGYIGRITNAGAQHVEAPIDPGNKKGKEIVITGQDLRTGTGRK